MPRTPVPEAKKFGETLRRLRGTLTQQTLAHNAGLAINFLSELERGQKVPSLTTILQLAHALKVAPGDLLADFSAADIRKAVKPHLK